MISAAPATAVDGDTVVIAGERIRVANIDTPEIHHALCDAERRLGQIAKRRAQQLLDFGRIVIKRGDPGTGRLKDRYGRILATITVDGRDFGAIMIEEGLARPWVGKRQPWCE